MKMLRGSFLLVTLILVSSDQIQGNSSTCSYPYRKIGANCYYISTDTASWDDAYVNCLHRGGHLANLETFDEFMILRSWLSGLNNGQSYSIGGRKKDGVWEWVKDGRFSKMSYFVFSPSEPDGSKSKPENCVAIASGSHYYVYDFSCNSVVRYICEK